MTPTLFATTVHPPLHGRAFFFLLTCWAAYLFATPFHLVPSGYPQPADVLMLVPMFAGACIFLQRERAAVPPAFLLLGLFAALTLVVNLAWFAFHRERLFLLSSLFTVFNAGVFALGAYILVQGGERARLWTVRALAGAIAALCAWVGIEGADHAGRAAGSFDNPNQLAYWALTSLLAVMALRADRPFGRIDAFMFGGCGFLILASLSKSGIVAFAAAALVIAASPRTSRTGRLMFVAGTLILALAILVPAPGGGPPLALRVPAIAQTAARVASIGADADDTLAARGYTRLATHPQYMIFGAGEGGFRRFAPYGSALEIHSGFAGILFSYGILGLGLFCAFLASVFRGSPWHVWALLGPVVLHSLAHQTFRFTTFWIFAAAVYAMTETRRRDSIAR